jgi:hypothetical protein
MATCVGCSSNSTERQLETCTGIGAAVGAMAGGAGGLFIRMETRGGHRTIGDIPKDNLIARGVGGGAIGALLGAGIGRAVCQPTEEPRSVTYYGTHSSSSSTMTGSSYGSTSGTTQYANP